MGIWRNIGKIVILVFQIVHEQVKWYIRSFKRDTTKKSNINKLRPTNGQTTKKLNNKVLNELSRLKKNEIIKRYNEEQEVVHERPHYNIKPE